MSFTDTVHEKKTVNDLYSDIEFFIFHFQNHEFWYHVIVFYKVVRLFCFVLSF